MFSDTKKLMPALDLDFSLDLLEKIWKIDRLMSYDAFAQSTGLVAEVLKGIGCVGVEVHKYPANGKDYVGDWRTPKAFDVKSATLILTDPAAPGIELANYAKAPTSIFLYSPPTPEGGIVTDLVYLSDDAPKEPDMRGKIVFLDTLDAALINRARDKGAIGIASDFFPLTRGVREKNDLLGPLADAQRWNNDTLFSQSYKNQRALFGFSLSPRNGARLRELFRRKKSLRVKAEICSRLYDGYVYGVTGLFPGKRLDESVLLNGHLHEVGAHDNASGVAAAIGAVKLLRDQIALGKRPRPERSIRLLFGHEIYASLGYYFRRQGMPKETLFGVNLDMLGGDFTKCRTSLLHFQSPLASCHYVDALLHHAIRQQKFILPARHEDRSFLVNDTLQSDPMIGVPTPLLCQMHDLYYHSNFDTPDKIHTETFAQMTTLLASFAGMGAWANAAAAEKISRLTADWAIERYLSHKQDQTLWDATQARLMAEYTSYRILSAGELATGAGRAHWLKTATAEIERVKGFFAAEASRDQKPPTAAEKKTLEKLKKIRPCRKVWGPPADGLVDGLHGQPQPDGDMRWSSGLQSALFWMNGQRDLATIWRSTRLDYYQLTPSGLLDSAEHFKEAGLIDF